MRATLRAMPTLLRVGLAEAIAYRAEMIVWILTNTMPLVNLALWSAVARGGKLQGYGASELTAYFLTALLVRQLTGSWVLWEMSRDIRLGLLSLRMLRPIHPLVAYGAENISAIPLRAGLMIPVVLITLALAGTARFSHDPLVLAMVPVSLVGAWLITFFAMVLIGSLGFFIEQSASIFDLWLAAFFTLSGYLFPLDFLASRAPLVMSIAKGLPFYLMNGFPVELLLGLHDRGAALRLLGLQWIYVVGFTVVALLSWNAGMKRYNAYGA